MLESRLKKFEAHNMQITFTKEEAAEFWVHSPGHPIFCVQQVCDGFDHLNRRTSDSETCTMYLDLGWGGMKIAIAHGSKMIFGKQVQIGGRQLDGLIAERSGTDLFTARMRRISETRQGESSPPSTARERVAPPVDGLAMLRATRSDPQQTRH